MAAKHSTPTPPSSHIFYKYSLEKGVFYANLRVHQNIKFLTIKNHKISIVCGFNKVYVIQNEKEFHWW